MANEAPRLASVAAFVGALLAVALLSPRSAWAQSSPPTPPDDYAAAPSPAAPDAKPEEPARESDSTGGSSEGSAEPKEEAVDERKAPPEPTKDEKTCTACIFIGIGAVVLIGAIPLAAQLDGAIRTRDQLRAWVREMDGADVGFIAGYGIAKANEDELNYAIATGVVAGIGTVVLGIGVGIIAYEGGFLKGPKEKSNGALKVGSSELRILPSISRDGGGGAIQLRF